MTSGSLVWAWGGVFVIAVAGRGSRGMEGVPSTLRAGPFTTTMTTTGGHGMDAGGAVVQRTKHISANAASMGAPQSMRARAASSDVTSC